MLNNPIRYIDPSGHDVCDEDYYCYSPHGNYQGLMGIQANQNGFTPTILSKRRLSSEKGWQTGISAQDLYDYYLFLFYKSDGWWWSVYGNDADGFTVWDFFSLMTYFEASGHTEKAKLFAESGVRFYYGWQQTLKKPDNDYSKLDWFARFSQSAAGYVKNHTELVPYKGKNPRDMAVVGNSFKDPPLSWREGFAWDRPYGWGNASVMDANVVAWYETHREDLFIYWPELDPFYMPKGCAVKLTPCE